MFILLQIQVENNYEFLDLLFMMQWYVHIVARLECTHFLQRSTWSDDLHLGPTYWHRETSLAKPSLTNCASLRTHKLTSSLRFEPDDDEGPLLLSLIKSGFKIA